MAFLLHVFTGQFSQGASMNALMKDPLHEFDDFYLGEEEALKKLQQLDRIIEKKSKYFLGYPCNEAFKLEKFFKWWSTSSLSRSAMNDVGNPLSKSSYGLNARPFEISVLEYFSKLFKIKDYWGYVTSGGTQGNEQGLYLGRESLAKDGKPILYFTEDAHYSIASLGKILSIEMRIIRSFGNGEMDEADLMRKLDSERPALFSLSIGTTFKGAIDRIETVQQIVRQKGLTHVFYHADAALFGGYLPFYSDSSKPNLDFEKFPYDSIAVSGHKFFGSPTPLGVFLTKAKYATELKGDYIEYIHSQNITIPCSRSSLNTLIFWWTLMTTPQTEFKKAADKMIEHAEYFYGELKKRNHPVWLNPHSNTVFFKAPSQEVVDHWTLSTYTCPKLGPLAHAIVMPHVTKEMIDEFLNEFFHST